MNNGQDNYGWSTRGELAGDDHCYEAENGKDQVDSPEINQVFPYESKR